VSEVLCVIHVDTEGPLLEPFAETATRLSHLLGLDHPLDRATGETLEDWHERWAHTLPEPAASAFRVVGDPHLLRAHSSWKEVEEGFARVADPAFRQSLQDSFGQPIVVNWHVLDHVGFGNNPRHRDMGWGNVFRRYREWLKAYGCTRDALHWHFHPASFSRDAHISATSYTNSYPVLNEILARRLIDHQWFPVVNRAGFHTVRPDSSLFLEQWIPFDASNQAAESDQRTDMQADVANGRFGDWRGAPSDWSIYQPDFRDWRRPGGMRRYISRCLNIRTRLRNIDEREIVKAFELARRSGRPVYLGVTNHDFREMSVEFRDFHAVLARVAARHPDVKFRHCEAVDAFRRAIGGEDYARAEPLKLAVGVTGNVLRVQTVAGEVFGPQPFLAIRTRLGGYHHDNLDFDALAGAWTYTFDGLTLPLEVVDAIAIGANDRFGHQSITVLRHGDWPLPRP
jgi:hypothetical protein